jgi:hypothetical protein
MTTQMVGSDASVLIERPTKVPFWPPKILYRLLWDRTQASYCEYADQSPELWYMTVKIKMAILQMGSWDSAVSIVTSHKLDSLNPSDGKIFCAL